ncbi:MAG: hypothetical protein WCL37_03910 [Chrysiogenales bacterium]
MSDNFREALVALSRALPLIIFRAGIFVAGGFMVIILFAISLFIFRLSGGVSPVMAIVVAVLAVLGWWGGARILRRFFLFRQRAAMLLLFSGWKPPFPGLAAVIDKAGRFFPNYSSWVFVNRGLRRALSAFYRGRGEFFQPPAGPSNWSFSRSLDLLATGLLSQAILTLAFSRGGADTWRSVQESLALYFQHGNESRRLARQWLWFSAVGLAFLFLCLALPNWFIFRSAGAPVEIGIFLAAVIAWLLYQAFVIPFALAGISGGLLGETRGKTLDADLCGIGDAPFA